MAASFLGRPAADDANHLILAAALFSFSVAIGGSVYVLVPRSWFTFSLVGSAVSEQLYELRGDIDEIHRRLAYDLDRFWENDRSTRRLFVWFRVATVGLAAQSSSSSLLSAVTCSHDRGDELGNDSTSASSPDAEHRPTRDARRQRQHAPLNRERHVS